MHRLSVREKREFYAGLARLIRSGTSLPAALELLARDTARPVAQFLRALNQRIKEGETLGDALLHQQPRVTELEATIITAAGRSGRLERGCDQLARYFEALDRARGEMSKRMMYPVLVLTSCGFIVNIKDLLLVSVNVYLKKAIVPLVVIYSLAAVVWIAWRLLTEAARHNVAADMVLARIPGIGPIRQKFALTRFFATLDAQLEAGVNIWEAFANAARTSDSARMIAAARQAMPMLQAGDRLSEVLARKKMIPAEYVRSFRVAEQAGETDAELTRLAEQAERQAVAALDRWSEWLPRVAYAFVVVYTVFQLVAMMRGYVSSIENFAQPN